MKIEEAIKCLECDFYNMECCAEEECKCDEAITMAIEALNKTSDKLCSRCQHINICAIFDNFNIDYCSDWSEEE